MRLIPRAAWTVHEMLVSLCVMGVVAGLASHAAVAQLRFFGGAGEILAVRAQLGEVGTIVAAVLWGVSPSDGEVLAARDSALEVSAPIGAAVVCDGAPGRVTIAAPDAADPSFAAFDEAPKPGDVARVFIADSIATGWVSVTLASAPNSVPDCPGLAAATRGWMLLLREPVVIPGGTVLRLARPMRLSLYHASDSEWYLGVRDWNVTAQRLNTIQPVAGPLLPYSQDAARSGLRFAYYDATGAALSEPINLALIAAVSVVARADSRRPVRMPGIKSTSPTYSDSATTWVALRNAR